MSRVSPRVPCGLLSLLPVIAISSPVQAAPLPPVRAVVLGIAQDGGVPHIGCTQALCVRARRDPARRERVACLGLVDDRAGARFLIDATPDLPSQLDSLNQGRTLADPRRPVDGILLTHAHIGHYTGLMYLGREALGARAVPVYATARMASLLRTSRTRSTQARHDTKSSSVLSQTVAPALHQLPPFASFCIAVACFERMRPIS